MSIYRYLINDEIYPIPLLLSKGDKINVKEVFRIKVEKEECTIDEVIWRCNSEGLYAELYFRNW